MRHPIFLPLVAQTVLVVVVWVRMYITRIRELRQRKLSPQTLSTSVQASGVLTDVAAADNFRNLFEIPVLFYAVGCALAIADAETVTQVVLAWLFVGLRAVHTYIHLTYNRVMHRFTVYVLSSVVVFVMWALFAVFLITDG
jgi:hypothetical protein